MLAGRADRESPSRVAPLRARREIGLLVSMGGTERTLRAAFCWLGALLGAMGTFGGAAVGSGAAWILDRTRLIRMPGDVYFLDYLPFRVPASDLLLVVGATYPDEMRQVRALCPELTFLVPGIGAQGGRVEDVAPAFAPGRAGGLVTASRSIVNAYDTAGGDPGDAALAEAERLRAAAWALRP